MIERSDEDNMRPLEGDQALEILMENCADSYGFPPYESIEEFLQGLRGGRSLVGKERDIVGSALDGIPATRLRSSTMDWWRMLPVGTAPRRTGGRPPPGGRGCSTDMTPGRSAVALRSVAEPVVPTTGRRHRA